MIDGVEIKKLNIIKDERGYLMEILRCDDKLFKKFGQVYLTACNPGYVKGWHYHKKQTDNFVCVKGEVRIGLYDNREDSRTREKVEEFIIGEKNPLLVQIPPGVIHGFESNIDGESVIVNIPTKKYDYNNPDEFRIDPFDNNIPLKWKSKKGG